jgi:hypothetical protein
MLVKASITKKFKAEQTCTYFSHNMFPTMFHHFRLGLDTVTYKLYNILVPDLRKTNDLILDMIIIAQQMSIKNLLYSNSFAAPENPLQSM